MTDTNQAREDLEAKLNTIIFARFYDIPDKQRSTIVKNLSKLIRTEKLKLLAEVRERVVGESDYQPGNPAPDLVEHNQLVRDGLRFEQRTALTKLEAEL